MDDLTDTLVRVLTAAVLVGGLVAAAAVWVACRDDPRDWLADRDDDFDARAGT